MNTLFERVAGGKDEWLTPPSIIKALGEFDLDPCSPINRPWDTAKSHLTIEDDGLISPWPAGARIWCNPPYGSQCTAWPRKMARHGNGIALTFARTETKMFFDSVWSKADGILFISGRLKFYHVTGEVATESAGAPSVLISYGSGNNEALNNCGLGRYVQLK